MVIFGFLVLLNKFVPFIHIPHGGFLLDPVRSYWFLLDPTGSYWNILDLPGELGGSRASEMIWGRASHFADGKKLANPKDLYFTVAAFQQFKII